MLLQAAFLPPAAPVDPAGHGFGRAFCSPFRSSRLLQRIIFLWRIRSASGGVHVDWLESDDQTCSTRTSVRDCIERNYVLDHCLRDASASYVAKQCLACIYTHGKHEHRLSLPSCRRFWILETSA